MGSIPAEGTTPRATHYANADFLLQKMYDLHFPPHSRRIEALNTRRKHALVH